MKTNYDIVVIGGGPAGATAAALTAAANLRVLLLEREPEPIFRIGESLMPATYGTFKRIGMLDKLRQTAFPKKYSVQFFSRNGKASAPFYFFENNDHESSQTWQVLRSQFDQMMLDNAAEKGADVMRGARVVDVLFKGDRAEGVVMQNEDGEKQVIECRVVVDASGQSAFISRKLKLSFPDVNLKKAAIFTHFRGVARAEGIDEGATLVLHTETGATWFWYIPLPDDVVSIGVVGNIESLLQNRPESHQEIFDSELQQCQPLLERMTHARQLFPVKTIKEFSYRSSKIAGPGWVLAGDAFGFLDPIYSSGVFLALKSGEMAADAIVEAFSKNDFSGGQLGKFEREFLGGMNSVRNLVYAFYSDEFNFGIFLRKHPEFKQGIVDILIGNVFDRDFSPMFAAMSDMCQLPDPIL
jgi:flavin-dependent dehydrogenase